MSAVQSTQGVSLVKRVDSIDAIELLILGRYARQYADRCANFLRTCPKNCPADKPCNSCEWWRDEMQKARRMAQRVEIAARTSWEFVAPPF